MPDEDKKPTLADIIYRIDPGEAHLVAATASVAIKQITDEMERENPRFAAEQRKHRREMKAWRRGRNQLANQLRTAQLRFIACRMLGPNQDAADLVLKVTDYLYEYDAPADLILGLLRVLKPLVDADHI